MGYGSLADVSGCSKNPDHVGFYSLADLNEDLMPQECKTEEWVSYIRAYSKRVVRLTVCKPDGTKLFGSGCVVRDIPSGDLYIKTNHHVIGSPEDFHNCTVEFFYDTEDRVGIETCKVVELVECDEEKGLRYFTCDNIPETIKLLMAESIVIPPRTHHNNIIVISHPHGAPKTITFGKYLDAEDTRRDGVVTYMYTAVACIGSSGGASISTKWGYAQADWRDCHNSFTHFAGKRGDSYNGMVSETNNINWSILF